MQNKTVSVFETTIRVLGGLLSAHLIASDSSTVSIQSQNSIPFCIPWARVVMACAPVHMN